MKMDENKALMFWKLSLGNPNDKMFGTGKKPKKKEKATTKMGKFQQMPEDDKMVAEVKIDMTLTPEEFEIIQMGHIPDAFEDHWFMACEEDCFRYYRSMSGSCSFEAHFRKSAENCHVDRLRINKSLCQFGVTSEKPAVFLFFYLVTAELGKDWEKAWERFMEAVDKDQEDIPYRQPAFTPERIDHLEKNEIFVFGSNLAGHHKGGAAWAALHKFGAVWGVGVGLQGQSYAIPTMQGGVETIRPYVDQFIEFAKMHPELVFLVTRIGCGIAGFRESEIAPLFKQAKEVGNIVLPRGFVNCI